MPVDMEKLKEISAATPARPRGVEGLLHDLHRAPELRRRVTLETAPLAPIPYEREGRWFVVALLAVPSPLPDGTEGFFPPWAAVEWSWPEQAVVKFDDLREREETALLRSRGALKAHPPDAKASLEPLERALRARALFRALDKLLASTPGQDRQLESLAGHYAGLLPPDAYLYYWTLVPESRAWLRPDAKAPTLSPRGGSEDDLQTRGDNESATASSGARRSPDTERSSPEAERSSPDTERSPDTKRSQSAGQSSAPEQKGTESPSARSGVPERPTDLTPRLGPWLRKSLALAESVELENVVSELKGLDSRRRLPGFRLAFVGEFNRGKSTLVNRLLGRALLPVGALPTTACVTSLVAGAEERMEVFYPDGRHETRPLHESSWNDLAIASVEGREQEAPARVRVTLDSPWLRAADVELIDTPGVGDLNTQRAALVSDLLSQCDAVVLVVSATSPFSMTEAAFLEEEVLSRHIPLILTVVSKLDGIPAGERGKIFDVIRERAAQVSHGIPVISGGVLGADEVQDEALDEVRRRIEALAAEGDRRGWRSRQIAGLIAGSLARLVESGKGALDAAGMEREERERALNEAKAGLREDEMKWEQLRIELEQRRLQCEQELRKRIAATRGNLLDLLQFELKRTHDPKAWAEREMPFRVRRETAAFSRQLEDFLIAAIARDFAWLQSQVSNTFAARMARGAAPQAGQEVAPVLPHLELADTQRMRFLSRVGSGAATIAGYLIVGPLASAAAVAWGLASEPFIDKKVQAQRDIAMREVNRSIDQFLDEYANRVSERLRGFYRQLIADTKREQSAWRGAKVAALEAGGGRKGNAGERPWRQAIEAASVLRDEINAAMQG